MKSKGQDGKATYRTPRGGMIWVFFEKGGGENGLLGVPRKCLHFKKAILKFQISFLNSKVYGRVGLCPIRFRKFEDRLVLCFQRSLLVVRRVISE